VVAWIGGRLPVIRGPDNKAVWWEICARAGVVGLQGKHNAANGIITATCRARLVEGEGGGARIVARGATTDGRSRCWRPLRAAFSTARRYRGQIRRSDLFHGTRWTNAGRPGETTLTLRCSSDTRPTAARSRLSDDLLTAQRHRISPEERGRD